MASENGEAVRWQEVLRLRLQGRRRRQERQGVGHFRAGMNKALEGL